MASVPSVRLRRSTWIVGGGLLAVAVFGIAFVNWRTPPLLELARKATDASDWNRAGFNRDMTFYWWLSDRELLVGRDSKSGIVHFSRCDLPTHRETPLPVLDRQVHASRAALYEMRVAPEGQWMLWGGHDSGRSMAVSLDGRREVHLPHMPNSSPQWLPDGRHWLDLVFQWSPTPSPLGFPDGKWTHGEIHDIKAPNRPPEPFVIPLEKQPGRGGVTLTPGGILLSCGAYRRDANGFGRLSFCTAGVGANTQPRREVPMPLPRGAQVMQMDWSPDGKQVAWVVKIRQSDPVTALLHRFIARIKQREQTQIGLWVCRIDGTRVHEIGVLPSAAPKGRYKEATRLLWLPDGRHVSFLYDRSLWTVSVD